MLHRTLTNVAQQAANPAPTSTSSGLSQNGLPYWHIVTPSEPTRRGPLVCVRSTDVDALVSALAGESIVVSAREDKARIALHLYNVEHDVDRLLEALTRHRALLA